jgi:rhomboid protease GluP
MGRAALMPLETHAPTGLPTARIAARSRGQAMDWSLVLASQGIEHIVDHTPEMGWALLLAGPDHEAARAAIRQSRLENRYWRRTIPHSRVIFDWAGGAWVLLTMGFYWLSVRHPGLRAAGIMDGTALAQGEWWRWFTATLLHADLAHLASNALFGFLLLGLAMGRYGTGVGLLAAFLAGVTGNLATWFAHGKLFHGLGASGVVMGALGLVAVQSFGLSRKDPRTLKIIFGGLAGGMMLFVLLGFSPGTDVVAHGGGFVAGIGLGCLLAGPVMRRRATNLAAGTIFVTLVIWTGMLALRHAR